mmetsp:Transcript_94736/g.277112  ORF Transcript_94736/g.277112 Transcript_94736/m.277112 type:complete len:250 (+) Transcript_94736:63-812(+)
MADPSSSSVEEGHSRPEEASALLLDADAAPLSEPQVRERLAWRVAALGFTLLALLGAAYGALFPKHTGHRGLALADARGVEQKFYDDSGAYWQAPSRGISSSEVWGSCDYPHLHICGSYCCCDEDYYWKSPRTIYQQGKTIVKKAALGTAVMESHGLSATAAELAAKDAAEALGKAAIASVISKEQSCVPRAEVPADVVEALDNSARIPRSDAWVACSTFTSNSHTCGGSCCCNGGFGWSSSSGACLSK